MAKIEWDAAGSRFYETGVNHGVLYVSTGSGTYGKGVAWNGLTSVSESPDGAEANDFYADNIKYASMRSAENFKGSIEAYTYPDEFMDCDGSKSLAQGVYIGQQSRAAFGLCYRTEIGSDDEAADTDKYYKIHLVYNCTASPSEKSYETINDSPDAITFSWDIEATPINVAGFKPTSTITIDTRKADAVMVKKLEDTLYGSDDEEPKLPSPSDILNMFSESTGS